MLAATPPTPVKNDNQSRQPQQSHPSPRFIPRYDLRLPVLPRHVRLLIGAEIFCEDALQL